MKSFLIVSLLSSVASAQVGYISDFKYQVTDIAENKLQKEVLFNRLERKMLDLEKSICSNRAQLWAYDLYRFYGINTGKIFIFFTSNIWRDDKKGWMYHVAPYIVENGTEYVMEATYSDVTKPLTVEEWAENEMYGRVKGSECLEITAADTDLTEYFYERHTLPEKRSNGKLGAKCYIRKVPGYYWFPTSIALHDLKQDEKGKPVEYNPKSFDVDDVLEACTEAASTKLGRILGGGRAKCKKHLGL